MEVRPAVTVTGIRRTEHPLRAHPLAHWLAAWKRPSARAVQRDKAGLGPQRSLPKGACAAIAHGHATYSPSE
jgi:hypothetical protein